MWNLISVEAKELITAFLTVEETKRMTAGAALSHPWFTLEQTDLPSLEETQRELKRNYRQMFRSAVQAVQAVASMKRMSVMADTIKTAAEDASKEDAAEA